MAQETEKIKDHIEARRGRLERDLHEIEQRFTKATDWRDWFDRYPIQMLGAAAAGGFLLSLLIRSPEASPISAEADETAHAGRMSQSRWSRSTSWRMDRLGSTLDNTVAALLGVASRKVRDFVADVVPDFREEYREIETQRTSLENGSHGVRFTGRNN
jgi:hypothetical protein